MLSAGHSLAFSVARLGALLLLCTQPCPAFCSPSVPAPLAWFALTTTHHPTPRRTPAYTHSHLRLKRHKFTGSPSPRTHPHSPPRPAQVTGSVSGRTSFLVVGKFCGRSKYDQARGHKVRRGKTQLFIVGQPRGAWAQNAIVWRSSGVGS